jgi:hypothetical protein
MPRHVGWKASSAVQSQSSTPSAQDVFRRGNTSTGDQIDSLEIQGTALDSKEQMASSGKLTVIQGATRPLGFWIER